MATSFQGMDAFLGPDLVKRQREYEQRLKLVQALMSQKPRPEASHMVSGHYVGPDWGQRVSDAFQTWGTYKMGQELREEEAKIRTETEKRKRLAFGLTGDEGEATPASPEAMRLGEALQSGGGLTNPSVATMPLLPGMDGRQSMAAYDAMGPSGYFKAVMSAMTPEQRNLAHLAPGQRNQLIEAGYLNEAAKDGVQIVRGDDGRLYSVPVTGYAGSVAQIEGAKTGAQGAAKAEYDLVRVPDGRGGEITMPRSQAVRSLGPGQAPASGAPPEQLGRKPSESETKARDELPKIMNQADQMIASIDGILGHPGLPGAVGMPFGAAGLKGTMLSRIADYVPGAAFVPGTQERDFVARADQLKGQAFLQAFESLKGGGAITEVEGRAATDAMGRLSRAQSETAYKEALNELKGILNNAKRRAYANAGLPFPEQAPSPAAGGGASAQDASSIPRIQSPVELEALPSGAIFIAPDGSRKRKP